jgi:2'-5' RNA ligase
MVATQLDGVPETTTNVRSARIFVALRIMGEIAQELAQYGKGLEQLSIRPVPAADIHLTLVPPWNEVSIPDAVAKLRRVADTYVAFPLVFRHIGYGPEPRHPRFLWVECAASNEIAESRAALLRAFGQADERPFHPHVTLARLRDKGRVIARKQPVDQNIAFTQRVDSVELMQSPPPGGSGYKVLASLSLGENPELPSAA